jgi:translation initiation factor eIF-2B subunit delta
VLIGADTFSDDVVVNKIGTTALALLAREHNKPVYCFTTMNKYVPPEFKQAQEKDNEAGEVWPGAPEGVRIRNKYFENTPMHLLKSVITEAGHFDAKNQTPEKKYHIDEWLRKQL